MPFDYETYTPGDPWESSDFFTRALTAPRIEFVTSVAGEATPDSYFEFRAPNGGERFVEMSIEDTSGTGDFTVVLERSFDNGTTWGTIDTFIEPAEETIRCNNCQMLRLRLALNGGGGDMTLRLIQHL